MNPLCHKEKHIERMWISLKKSLHCKPHSSEVHDPMANEHHRMAQSKKQGKDFIYERKSNSEKHLEKQKGSSPISQGSSAIFSAVTHEIVLDASSGEIKFCPCCPFPQNNEAGKGVGGSHRSSRRTIISEKTHYVGCDECNFFSKPRVLVQKDSNNDISEEHEKHECGVKLKSLDTIEKHVSEEHAVIQLHKEDSSWQIMEKICQTSYINSESMAAQVECILKVLNPQKTFACFEECREMARINAEKLQDKHPRCLADGNELLRFHGTTVACSLGINGSSSLCTFDQCGVCQILRHGFSTNNQEFRGPVGVLTTSTSEKAFDSIGSSDEPLLRKSVMVCRVIAGRIHNPLQDIQEMITDSGFDSLVKKLSAQSDIEELHVLNPTAILPCFVVIYKM